MSSLVNTLNAVVVLSVKQSITYKDALSKIAQSKDILIAEDILENVGQVVNATEQGALTGEETPEAMAIVHAIMGEAGEHSFTWLHPEAATPVSSAKSRYPMTPEFGKAVDTMFNSIGLPSFTDIVGGIDASEAKIKSLEETISRMSSMTTMAKPKAVSSTGEMPKGDIVWKPAIAVLADAGITVPSTHERLFQWDAPQFVWEHDHPLVKDVDPNYQWRWDMLAKLMWSIVNDKKPWVWGHTGTGKTTLIEQVSAIMRWPFVRINFDSEITRMDLVGRDTLTNDEKGNTISKFVDGILPASISQPCIVCNDELDFVRPDVGYVFQRMMEGNGVLLNEDGGRFVEPHPMCRMVATANTQGQGDEFGLYQGARVQSSAFLDRFQTWIEVPYLEPEAEKRLIAASVPALAKDMLDKLSSYVIEHREAFKQALILKPLSPRGVVSMAQSLAFFTSVANTESEGVRMALDLSLAGSVSSSDLAKINELIDRTFN